MRRRRRRRGLHQRPDDHPRQDLARFLLPRGGWLGLPSDAGHGHARSSALRLSPRALAPSNAHPTRRRHRSLRARCHRRLLRRRRHLLLRGYGAVLVPLLLERGLPVLLLVLRRRLPVLLLGRRLAVLLRRGLAVLPVLLLRRGLSVITLLLRRRSSLSRRRCSPSRRRRGLVDVLPLLGVVVLLILST